MSRRAWFSVGSNLGDRLAYLQIAADELASLGPARVSGVYETAPVGGVEQPDYLNIVVEVACATDALELLGQCHRIEAAAGRERVVRWGARTLDIDIIAIEGLTLSLDDLEIPHPRAREREFVLAPLSDLIDPTIVGLPAAVRTGDVRLTPLSISLGEQS